MYQSKAARGLARLADQHEGRPVGRILVELPAAVAAQRAGPQRADGVELGLAESRRLVTAVGEQRAVEALHLESRDAVGHPPKADQNRWRSGVKESSRQSDDAVAVHLSEAGIAGREGHQAGGQPPAGDLAR